MPSTSAKQSRFMAAIAHSPSFAKKVGVSQSVGKDFNTADKGKTFNKGGMMKKRRFDEGGDVSAYEIDPDSRRAHGLYDEEPTPKKAAPKKTAPKTTEVVEAPKKAAPKQAAPKTTEVAEAPKQAAPKTTEVAEAPASKRKSFSDFMEGARSFRSTRGMAKGGAVMKEPKDAMMPRRPRGMTPPVAPPMGMGMKKGGMPMKDGKPAFMKKFAEGGSIDDDDSKSGGMGPITPRRVPSDETRGGAKTAMIPTNRRNNDSNKLTGGLSAMKKYAKGGGIESRGKTKGTIIRMASGGSVSSASRRADGIAQRGKTRC